MPTTTTLTMTLATIAAPTCYACDAEATGAADRTHEDGEIVPACDRHAHRGLRLVLRRVCYVCGGAWSRKSPAVDGDCVHQNCYEKDCAA